MKRLAIMLALLLTACATAPVVERDICEELNREVTIPITVVTSEKEYTAYFYTVGGVLALKMAKQGDSCVEGHVLMGETNLTVKGIFCVETRDDGTWMCEKMCEYIEGDPTGVIIKECHPLGGPK